MISRKKHGSFFDVERAHLREAPSNFIWTKMKANLTWEDNTREFMNIFRIGVLVSSAIGLCWFQEFEKNFIDSPSWISQKIKLWIIEWFWLADCQMWEPLESSKNLMRFCLSHVGAYITCQIWAQGSEWYMLHLHQILTPKTLLLVWGSLRLIPPESLGEQRVFQSIDNHFFVFFWSSPREGALKNSDFENHGFGRNKNRENI